MHFKKRTATGHLFGPLQFAVTLGLFHVAKRQRLGCLRRCYNGLLSSDFSGSAWTENKNCLASTLQCGQVKVT